MGKATRTQTAMDSEKPTETGWLKPRSTDLATPMDLATRTQTAMDSDWHLDLATRTQIATG
jgi:hypothetical protein